MSVTTQTFVVQGMTCEHCVGAVTEELEKLRGVREVRVDLSTGAVAIDSDAPLDSSTVEAAVDEAGYELLP